MKKIRIKVSRANYDKHDRIMNCVVIARYSRFVVLHNGKYAFCADVCDLKHGKAITI